MLPLVMPSSAAVPSFVRQLQSAHGDFGRLSQLLRDKQVIAGASAVLDGVFEDKSKVPKRARTLLAAFMMSRHAATVSSVAPHQIEQAAGKVIDELVAFTSGSMAQDQFADAFADYEAAFDAWQQADLKALKGTLEAELSTAESLSTLVASDPEWAPHVAALQEQMKQAFQSLPSSKPTSNAQIAHDLFLDGASYEPASFDTEICVESEQDFLKRAKEGLLGLVEPGKDTHALINGTLDLAVSNYDGYTKFILDMMRQLCAPIRDQQVEQLYSERQPVRILEALRDMTKDMIHLNLAKALPNLPTIIVQYERDAFVKAFKTVEHARRMMKRIYVHGEMTGKDLAWEMFALSLAKDNQTEMFYLDKARLAKWRAQMDSMAAAAAAKMLGKQPTGNDPTVSLLKERIIQGVVASASDRLKGCLAEQFEAFELLKQETAKFMEHHYKVYEPVYHSLLLLLRQ